MSDLSIFLFKQNSSSKKEINKTGFHKTFIRLKIKLNCFKIFKALLKE